MSETEILFTGNYLSLRKISTWEYATRPNARAVVGIFATTPENEVILVEQFRHPMQAKVIEICAGLVGDDQEFADESLADCARRELLEETGYTSDSLTPLVSSPTSAGMSDEMTHLFHAENCTQIQPGGGVGGEKIMVHRVPQADLSRFLEKQLRDGNLVDFKIHSCLGALGLRNPTKLPK